MRDKPLLLCDIDGVLSLWGFRPDMCPAGDWHRIDGHTHFLSRPAAQALLDLTGDFALVWCSGWEERADEHLPHLLGVPRGLPHLEFDRAMGGTSSLGHWKLDAIEAYTGDRPAAWVDDALDDRCRAWAAARAAPTLLVDTDPAVGLGPEHVTRLRAWAADLGRSER